MNSRSGVVLSRLRPARRSRPTLEALESRQVLDGGVPPGMDLGQANWFYHNTFAAPANVAPEWNGNVAMGDAGKLGPDYLAAFVARVNAYRWMVGLPGGVTLDPTENAEAQQDALMMAANKQSNHNPPPTWFDYTAAGADAAAHSNLYFGVSGVAAIDGYMIDPGNNNTLVGHRRWVLYPPTRTMGVGDIPGQSNALYVIQSEDPPAPAVTAVCWPPAGFVPAPLMPQRWSLQADWGADFTKATVAVTENGVPQQVEILSNSGLDYGGQAIVWDMPNAPPAQPGQEVVSTVQVDNVMINGQSQSFSYTTTTFDPTTTTAMEPVPAQVQFLQATASASAKAGSVIVEVARSMNADQQVSVDYAASDGTAQAGTDYASTSGVLTFAPGQFYQQISIPLLPGSARDLGGTFSLILSSPSGATLGAIGTAQVTIEGSQTPIVQPPLAPVLPRVLGVVEVQHARKKVSSLSIAFNEAMSPGSVSNVALYRFQGGVAKGRKVVFSKEVKVGHVVYDEAANTVSISLARPYGGQIRMSLDGFVEALDGVASDSAFSVVVR
jgi:hypothetical protein